MREHEIQLILKWIGVCQDGTYTEQMVRDAIDYAWRMGYTDGTGGGADEQGIRGMC